MVAASAALTLSGVPFMGPIGARASASSTANTC
jgi:polyribonucleotide nucleotidyltransferase